MDEVHERDKFTDFLLTVLKDCLPKFQHLKLLLMSASMDAPLYSKYFGSCPIIRVSGRSFPVTEYYLEDVLKYTKYNSTAMKAAVKKIKMRKEKTAAVDDWTKKLTDQLANQSPSQSARPSTAGKLDNNNNNNNLIII